MLCLHHCASAHFLAAFPNTSFRTTTGEITHDITAASPRHARLRSALRHNFTALSGNSLLTNTLGLFIDELTFTIPTAAVVLARVDFFTSFPHETGKTATFKVHYSVHTVALW